VVATEEASTTEKRQSNALFARWYYPFCSQTCPDQINADIFLQTQMLTTHDLTPDPVLLRKVKRIQAAERAQEENPVSDSDDDRAHDTVPRGTQRRQAEEIDDESGEDVDKGARARSLAPRVKAERLASSARESSVVVPATQRVGGGGGGGEAVGAQMVTGSGAVVVDLGEGEEEEDDDEYGYEEEA